MVVDYISNSHVKLSIAIHVLLYRNFEHYMFYTFSGIELEVATWSNCYRVSSFYPDYH